MDVGVGERVPTMDAKLGLTAVSGGADEMDGEIVGGDEAGEVEELVEMTLCYKRHHHNTYFIFIHLCFSWCINGGFSGINRRCQTIAFVWILSISCH